MMNIAQIEPQNERFIQESEPLTAVQELLIAENIYDKIDQESTEWLRIWLSEFPDFAKNVRTQVALQALNVARACAEAIIDEREGRGLTALQQEEEVPNAT